MTSARCQEQSVEVLVGPVEPREWSANHELPSFTPAYGKMLAV
jgi:hypothetical protein